MDTNAREGIEGVAHTSLDIGYRCGTFARLASIWQAFILITCILLFGKAEAHSAPTITYRTAESVLSLSYDKAVKGFAELRGTVTLSSPAGFVLQDDTAGIWVEDHRNHLSVGDVVTILGPVGPGAYSPQIESPTIRLNGHARLPYPKNVSFVQLSDGQEDAQYVAIEGVIRAVTLRDDALTTVPIDGTLLMVDMPGGRVDVALPTQSYKAAVGLIGAKVRVSATALARKNDDRQATGVVLIAPGIENLTILQPGPSDLFSTRMVPIGSLLQYRSGTDYFQRVRIQGTLTYYEQGHRFILQDRSRAIVAYPANSQPLEIGDRIEAVGFPAPDMAGPVLRDAVIRRLSHGLPPAPIPVTLQEARDSRYRSCLVSLHLRLVRVISEPTRTLFLLESGHSLATAELDTNAAIPAWLQPGSDLRLTGIDMLTVEEGIGYLNYFDATVHSVLLLRSLNDIALISPATWWTHARLLSLIVVLGALLAAFVILLIFIQLKYWKTKLTLRERERFARDVHDTLAQSFAGVGFQLQVIRRAITTGDPSLLHHVDTARDLVQFSHREARKSLAPSISQESFGADLLSSLHENAQALVKGGVIEIEANSAGSVRTIPRHANEELFRIGQEAIANAIRHANPTQLAISVEYEENLVRLKIIDNGKGFVMRGDLLGFGIRGMRKRASEINAQFDLVSVPGAGTTVAVTAPLQSRRSLLFLLNARETFLKSIGER
jgi:signal transduction histidine kinase